MRSTFLYFFKQKTSYEMRISDWSSDVCSSDLKTALQLSREVAGQLSSAGYYVKPQVLVDVVSYASRYVTVLGAVTSPGLVPIDRAYRVSEILARVGGKQDKGAEYLMLRRQDGEIGRAHV